MAVTNRNFGADVDAWVKETEARMTAVFRGAAQEVISEMQKPGPSVASTKAAIADAGNKIGPVAAAGEGGNLPIDTGFLRASLQVSVNEGPVPADRPNPNPKGKYVYNPSVASLAIAGAELGDTITASYSAKYAPMIEYGTSKTSPRGFVRLAAAQWQTIVQHQTVRAMLTVYSNRRKG